MKLQLISIKKLLIGAGMFFSMLIITAAFYILTSNVLMLLVGILLTACALV